MFIGEYEHTLDEKKRVSLPKQFRAGLGKKMVMTRGLDNCLFVYSRSNWEKVAAKLQALTFAHADTRGFNRFILSGAAEVEADGAGRILIPEHQKTFAGLKKTVVFAGVSDRVEVQVPGRAMDVGSDTYQDNGLWSWEEVHAKLKDIEIRPHH